MTWQMYPGGHVFRIGFISELYSQEEITLRVEMLYRLFLLIDLGLYRPKIIFLRGCAKFHLVAFFKIQYGCPNFPESLKLP